MIRSQATIADARELQTQLCAYNSAFEELDLMFRWDVETLQSLARAPGDHSRIAQYIDTHCPHLLKAYSAEFLCQAIVDKKNAHYEACRATDIPGPTIRTAPGCGAPLAPNRTQNPRELPTR